MKIKLNGKPRNMIGSLSIRQLLTELKLSPQHIVVEVNHTIVTPDQFSELRLMDNDEVEIVQFVGGG